MSDGKILKWQDSFCFGTNWISIKDRLPENYVDVLLFAELKDSPNKEYIIGHREDHIYFRCSFYECKGLNNLAEITHWMPLPVPPQNK